MDQEIIFEQYVFADTHGYKIVESLGYDPRRTDYREVYVVEKEQKQYILKIGRASHPAEKDNKVFEKEIQMMRLMSKHGISPKIIDMWNCVVYPKTFNEEGFSVGQRIMCIVSEKWDVTYSDYKMPETSDVNRMSDMISRKLFELIYSNQGIIQRFHALTGQIHGDAHPGNIVLNLDPSGIPKEAALIDFESMRPCTQQSIESAYPGWNEYFKNMFSSVQQFELYRIMSQSIYNTKPMFVMTNNSPMVESDDDK